MGIDDTQLYIFFVQEELRGFHLHVQPLYAMGWNFPAHDSVDLKQVDGLRSVAMPLRCM